MTDVKISVIIPTKNRITELQRCMKSMAAQTYEDFEMIIVEGGHLRETSKALEQYRDKMRLSLITSSPGLVAAMNQGLSASRGAIVIRTDDDVIASPGWLRAIADTFGSLENVGGVTGPTIVPDSGRDLRDMFRFQSKFSQGNLIWRAVGGFYSNYLMEGKALEVGRWFRSGAFSVGSAFPKSLDLAGPVDVDHHEACNMAVRADILKDIGGFDPVFKGIGDFSEPDVSFKIRKKGFRILFNPKALVYHLHSTSGVYVERAKESDRVRNFLTFYFRHIRPDNADKSLRLLAYLAFLNAFFVYKYLETGNAGHLSGLSATIRGLIQSSVNI